MYNSSRWSRRAVVLTLGWSLLHAVLGVVYGADLILTEADNGKKVPVQISQSLVLNLRGNSTTGYSWLLTGTNGNSVAVTGPSTYLQDPDGGVGVGGTFTFPFRAVAAGETTLTLEYRRSWETGPAAQVFNVTIVVRDGPTAPALAIERQGLNTIISWAVEGSSGCFLEGTQRVGEGWAALNVLPTIRGLNCTVTLPATGGALFFRLRQ